MGRARCSATLMLALQKSAAPVAVAGLAQSWASACRLYPNRGRRAARRPHQRPRSFRLPHPVSAVRPCRGRGVPELEQRAPASLARIHLEPRPDWPTARLKKALSEQRRCSRRWQSPDDDRCLTRLIPQDALANGVLVLHLGCARLTDAAPSRAPACFHSQSIRTADTVPGATRGFGAGKKVKGRKRFLVADTLGLVIAVRVVAASVQDRDGARRPLSWARLDHSRIQRFWADQGFAGRLARLVGALLSMDPAHRPDAATAERMLELTQYRDTPARGIHPD